VIVGATLGMSATITQSREYYKEVYERCTSQDITGIKWIKTNFANVTVKYNGGELYLSGVTFKDCKYEFGNDERSRTVLSILRKEKAEPINLLISDNFSSLDLFAANRR
jgi:hypothetical protein